jgi:ferredoxin
MAAQALAPPPVHFLPRESLGALVAHLRAQGYSVIAPVAVDGVVQMRAITRETELAHGLRDEQDGGKYRLVPGDPSLAFEHVVGPDSPKRHLFPPVQRLLRIHVHGEAFVMDAGPPQVPKLAFLGVRPCDLSAMAIQDKVFGADDPGTRRCEAEAWYTEARRQALVIVVNCTSPGGTCFCASMGTGPAAESGFDLAMTELRSGFVVQVGSERGQAVLSPLPVRAPTAAELELVELKLHRARERMGRQLDTTGLRELLNESVEHPQWEQVASRCLGCGNCTMVCPTCFCSTVTDTTDLGGRSITRSRQWESCFTHQFSYTTAGPVRSTIKGRYRHWIRHKLSTWFDQFGSSGCVGCGRCITWCPVGIDITREARQVRTNRGETTNSRRPVLEVAS